MILIHNCANEREAEMITTILKENNINCIVRSSPSGEYMKIRTGYTIYGFDIYVNESDVASAKQILESLSGTDDEQTELLKNSPWYKNKIVLARLTLIIVAITFFITLFFLEILH